MLRRILLSWRRLNAEIVIGFLVSTIFWIAVLGWQAADAPTEVEKQKCYEAAAKSGHKGEECKSLWERTTSDPVAFFTFWLVISTIGLGVSTVMLWRAGERQRVSAERIAERQRRSSEHIASRQLHSMRNANEAAYASVKVAQTSADAAKANADAAIAAERARFFIVIPDQNIGGILSDFVREPDPPGYFTVRTVTKNSPPRIGYRFKNYGKTPAIIKEISLGGEISTDPVEPVYSTIIHNFPENMIGYGEMTDREEFRHPQRLTREEAGVIGRNESRYWFFGKIDYEDVFGNPHTHRFYFRTVVLDGKCILQPYDYKHYNQST